MERVFIRAFMLCTLSLFSAAVASGHKASTDSDSPKPETTVVESATDTWRTRRLSFGKYVYTQACASCHDEGVDGAPAIGDRREWSSRSPLWLAVLFEHAKSGFLDMPAKGNNPELTDQAVDAAAEYMLSVTFPEQPLD